MDERAHRCPDEPEQGRKRHDLGMIISRRVHETGLAIPKVIATRGLDRRLEELPDHSFGAL
jgi:hypothetical protein